MSFATDSPSVLLEDGNWRRHHSRWLWWCYLGFGMLGFVGFFIIASRAGGKKWWRRAAIVGALHIPSWVLMGLFNDEGGGVSWTANGIEWGSGSSGTIVPADYAIILWICVIFYGLFVNREYLRWRAENPNEWFNQPVGGQTTVTLATAPTPVETPTLQEAPFLGVDTSEYYSGPPSSQPQVTQTPPPAPSTPAPAPAGFEPPPSGLIDINAASASEIATSVGVDDSVVRRVIDARIQHGGFSSLDDLVARAGLQPHEMLRFRDKVRFGTTSSTSPAQTPTPTKSPTEPGTGRILDY